MLEERRDQHYLRRHGNLAVRRSRWRRGLAHRTVLLTLQLAALAVVYLIGRQIYLATITSPRFDIRTIVVRGNRQAKTADLVALVSSALSRNIFTIDLEPLRENVRRHPWVLEAAVRRSLPSTLEITVTERDAGAIALFGGRSYLVDSTGHMLAEYGPEVGDYDFPVLTGFEGLPRPEAIRRIRTGAAAVSRLSAADPDFSKRISEIDLSSPDRLTLRPADGSPVLYAAVDDPLRNIDHYAEIQNLIPRALPAGDSGEPGKIASVDLRFRGRIVVMPRSAEKPPER